MQEFIKTITAYQLANHLLPGVLFAILAERLTKYSFVQEPLVLGLFLYFFLGIVLSRLGSLFLEPLLKRLRVIDFVPYDDFIGAAREDPKLELLSEINNSYRTYLALFLSLLLLRGYEAAESHFPALAAWSPSLLVVLLAALFLLSYIKQTTYITRRARKQKDQR